MSALQRLHMGSARVRVRSSHPVHEVSQPPGESAVTAPEWRVSTVVGPGGPVRERHAFADLSGHIAQAVCQHTAMTGQLGDDDTTVRLCPLCVLFVGSDLARGQSEMWR